MSSDTLVSDMGPGELVLVILACGIGALLIGAVGIGGVVILPALLVVGVQPAVEHRVHIHRVHARRVREAAGAGSD